MSDPIQYDIPPRLRPENLPGPQKAKTVQGKRRAEALAAQLRAEQEAAVVEQEAEAAETLQGLQDEVVSQAAEIAILQGQLLTLQEAAEEMQIILYDLAAWETANEALPTELREALLAMVVTFGE